MAKKTTKSAKKTTKPAPVKAAAKRRARSTKAKTPSLTQADIDAAKAAAIEADHTETDIFLRNQNTPQAQAVLLILREHWAQGAA